MATASPLNTRVDKAALTLTQERQQRSRILVEAPSVANADSLVLVRDASLFEAAMPPMGIEVFTHNGGLLNGVNANWAVNNGDEIHIAVYDPEAADDDRIVGSGADINHVPERFFVPIVHVLAGVTNGAATAAEVAASLNADATYTKYAYAGAGITANRVTLFPRGIRGRLKVTGGNAQTVIQWPSGEASNLERTFTRVTTSEWAVTYVVSTKTLTVTNGTGATVNRVAVVVNSF
jgi:hypothetical protein